MDRVNTATDIKPSRGGSGLGPGTDIRGGSQGNGIKPTEKPKVTIKPYKFTFD